MKIVRWHGISTYVLLALVLGLVTLGLLLLYQIPALNEHLYWRVEILRAEIRDRIFPHPDYVPPPRTAVDPNVVITLATSMPAAETSSSGGSKSSAPLQSLPDQAYIDGTVHRWQHWNNCGPATLAMTLNYWGWPGTQANTAATLKPNRNDRNVSPDEMVAYAQQMGYGALTRVGGTPELVQRLVASGIPVIVERDLWLQEDGWAGHYALIIGYDRTAGTYVTQDTFQGPELAMSEARLNEVWLPFNYRYVVLFPGEREQEVLAVLGAASDPAVAYQQAAQRAVEEISLLSGERQAMAYYNLGLSLQGLGDSAGAAAAFDQARLGDIPFRMLWYQPEIYAAYYDEGEYSEVIGLSSFALDSNSNSEEAHYWRGRAYEALGDQVRAIQDYRASVELNRNYAAPAQALAALGISN